jgi:hypothetical protein
MAQAFVPLVSRGLFTKKSSRRCGIGEGGQQLIETMLKRTLVEDGLGSAVLDNKKGRMKLKKYKIVMSKFTDREQIFAYRRDMK